MKIGVIVPTYNQPKMLTRVLDGLIAQSLLPEEVIIADDGSKEDTLKTIQPYLSHSKVRFVHVWQEDKGFRAAKIRNKAIKIATADYLVFLDGDCIPQRHFVKDHEELAQRGYFFQGKRVIVSQSASPNFSFEDTDAFYPLLKHVLLSNVSNVHHIVRIPFLPAHTTKKMSGIRSCNMGVFKDDLFAVNGFNQDFKGWGREDSEIVARLYNYGLKRKEHPFRAICYHLWHPEKSRDSLKANDRLLEKTLASKKYYCQSGISDERA